MSKKTIDYNEELYSFMFYDNVVLWKIENCFCKKRGVYECFTGCEGWFC